MSLREYFQYLRAYQMDAKERIEHDLFLAWRTAYLTMIAVHSPKSFPSRYDSDLCSNGHMYIGQETVLDSVEQQREEFKAAVKMLGAKESTQG